MLDPDARLSPEATVRAPKQREQQNDERGRDCGDESLER